MSDIAIGDFVKYNVLGGSIGIVIGKHPSPRVDHVYVRWVYGRDVKGDIMVATSAVKPCQLIHVSEETFEATRDRKGFGDAKE